MGGAPQVLDRDCVRALIDKGGQETRGNRGQKEQEKGQKGVPFLNFKLFAHKNPERQKKGVPGSVIPLILG